MEDSDWIVFDKAAEKALARAGPPMSTVFPREWLGLKQPNTINPNFGSLSNRQRDFEKRLNQYIKKD